MIATHHTRLCSACTGSRGTVRCHRLASRLLGLGLAAAVAAAPLLVPPVAAQQGFESRQGLQRYDIPPGPLSQVLNAFAQTSDLFLSGSGTLTEGRISPGLRGAYAAEEALQLLLAGTGLQYRFTGDDTVTLLAGGEGAAGGPLRLGPIQVAGQGESAYGPVEGYRAARSATATRTDTPIMETPASIQVVPERVVEDQASTRLRDVYRNISGVQPAFTGGSVSTTEQAIIRGFNDPRIYRNGFRFFDIAPVDLANVERIEVLKGPASVLFGLGEPGGLLNIVTKRPVDDTFAILEQEVGSHDRYRTSVDANSPLVADNSLLGRINVAYTNDGTFRDHDGIERAFIAPAVTWRPSNVTELTLDLSYSYEEYPFDHGLAFSAQGESIADVSTFLGEPDFRSEREEIFAGYTFTHDFNDGLTFRNVFSFHYLENRLNAFRHFGSTNPDNTVDRTFDRSVPEATTFTTTADLHYALEAGAMRHELLVGVDARLDPESGNGQDGPRSRGPFPIDIVNPRFGRIGAINFDNPSQFDEEIKWVGFYFQDQITMFDDRLHVLLGGRYDHVEQFVRFITPTFNFEDEQTDEAFTARGAALYELASWVSPYVSVAQSFNPTSPFTTSVDGLDPEEGMSYEAGLKLSFLEGRVTSTVAAYQINKENVPIADPNNPGFSLNGGELQSRGLEVDVSGELAPGWQVIANYALTDTEVVESDSLPEGSRFLNVPRHSASVWSSYEFQPGSSLRGLGFGAGVRGASDRLGDNAGTFDLDGFGVVDAALWYRDRLRLAGREQGIKAQINLQNAFDKEYFESSNGTASVFPGAPRTVIGTISIRF